MIRAVLIDVDNTLLDFNACAMEGMRLVCEKHGLPFRADYFPIFKEINDSLWTRVENGELTREGLYEVRWDMILPKLGIDFDGKTFEKDFLPHLAILAIPFDGAKELLRALSSRVPVCAASNAAHDQQLSRLGKSGLLPFFTDVYTSERLGAPKPSEAFFRGCAARLGIADTGDILMIGDSIHADIMGACAVGMKTCWFDPDGLPPCGGIVPDTTVSTLSQIIPLWEDKLQ